MVPKRQIWSWWAAECGHFPLPRRAVERKDCHLLWANWAGVNAGGRQLVGILSVSSCKEYVAHHRAVHGLSNPGSEGGSEGVSVCVSCTQPSVRGTGLSPQGGSVQGTSQSPGQGSLTFQFSPHPAKLLLPFPLAQPLPAPPLTPVTARNVPTGSEQLVHPFIAVTEPW